MPALLAALVAHNDDTGKGHSYAEKLDIVRQQIQLRKQLDRIQKVGDMKLQNHGQVGVEDPLELCVADFKVILQHEATHGIPKPLPPVLVEGRESLPGESALLKQLNKQQREAAGALTRKFYETHTFEDEPGEFVALKMSRTHVPNPLQYVGKKVKKLFEDNNWYEGKIIEYYDRRQWWRVKYIADGEEEDWSVPNMKRHLADFKCGKFRDGTQERPAASMRDRNRERTVTGRRENPLEDTLLELESREALANSGAEFENPVEWDRSIGTVWRLLKVYVKDDSTRWGSYAPTDEVTAVMEDDAELMSMDDFEAAHDVEVSPLHKIEAWIKRSAEVAEIVEDHPNRRRSPRLQGS
jgi:hypothetical protein